MEDKKHFITQKSLDRLNEEFTELKFKKIPAIANKINEAKAHGDLSENAEYHEAKEDMAWAQGRLMELEQLINNAEVIDESQHTKDKISLGSVIEVEINNQKQKYTIVGPQEADPFRGFISNESPLGEALLGGKEKETVSVKTPAGQQNYKILKIT